MKRLAVFLSMTAFSVQLGAQIDTLNPIKDTLHSVKKAVTWSAILPGAGQIYNHFAQPKGKKKAYWKVPLIYTGLGLAGFSLVHNQLEIRKIRNEYWYRKDNADTALEFSEYSTSGLLILEKQTASFRDYSILAFAFVYLLQLADAAVEAHFVHFDISKDLSLNIRPWTYQKEYMGLAMSFNFR